jgi:hypothetical protein
VVLVLLGPGLRLALCAVLVAGSIVLPVGCRGLDCGKTVAGRGARYPYLQLWALLLLSLRGATASNAGANDAGSGRPWVR